MSASSRLCGIPIDITYQEMGDTIWLALTGKGDPDYYSITRLAVEIPDDSALAMVLVERGLMPKARRLIATWYNGWADGPAAGQTIAVSYDSALMWRACEDWTKPPGECGGPFGYWHEPPAA